MRRKSKRGLVHVPDGGVRLLFFDESDELHVDGWNELDVLVLELELSQTLEIR